MKNLKIFRTKKKMNNRTKRRANLKFKKNSTSIKADNRSRKVKNDFSKKRKRQRGGRPWAEGERDTEWSKVLDKLNVHPVHWARNKNCDRLDKSLTDGNLEDVDEATYLQPRVDLTEMRCRMDQSSEFIDYMDIIGDKANRNFSEPWDSVTGEDLDTAGVTPRTHWKYTHIDHRFIRALSAREERPFNMFQVSFTSPRQFDYYYNLAGGETCRPLELADCVYQCFFALGLMTLDIAKQHAERARAMTPTPNKSITDFCKCAFGLEGDDIVYDTRRYERRRDLSEGDPDFFEETIGTFLNAHLYNGYATMIAYNAYNESRRRGRGHIIIAYKYNDRINYFDPQTACLQGAFDVTNPTSYFYGQQIAEGERVTAVMYLKMNKKNEAGFFELKTNECKVFDLTTERPPANPRDRPWFPQQTD